jgi:hypothetical protein
MLTGNGVPNDVISNFNSLSIIVLGPCLNVSLTSSLVEWGSLTKYTTVRSVPCIAQGTYPLWPRRSHHHWILHQHLGWRRIHNPLLESLPDQPMWQVRKHRSSLRGQWLGIAYLAVVGRHSIRSRRIFRTIH